MRADAAHDADSSLVRRPPVIFTVIDESYADLGRAWALSVRRASGMEPVFICSDRRAFEMLSGSGHVCEDASGGQPMSRTGKSRYPDSTFPNDQASFTNSLKMTTALAHLRQGRSVLYSDVDAIWLRDPVDDILRDEADMAFQPGSFPEEAKTAWGFSVCMGFFFMRPGAALVDLLETSIRRFDGSDQRGLNLSLLEGFDLRWESRPANWEHGRIEGGWTRSVAGRCGRTGLRLSALPHAYYQRHGTRPETLGHAYICHPNSPKDPAAKIRILRELGIDL